MEIVIKTELEQFDRDDTREFVEERFGLVDKICTVVNAYNLEIGRYMKFCQEVCYTSGQVFEDVFEKMIPLEERAKYFHYRMQNLKKQHRKMPYIEDIHYDYTVDGGKVWDKYAKVSGELFAVFTEMTLLHNKVTEGCQELVDRIYSEENSDVRDELDELAEKERSTISNNLRRSESRGSRAMV